MQTTFSEQIEAIQTIRQMISSGEILVKPEIDLALNDAGSTIAAVQFAPSPEWVKLQMEKDPLI